MDKHRAVHDLILAELHRRNFSAGALYNIVHPEMSLESFKKRINELERLGEIEKSGVHNGYIIYRIVPEPIPARRGIKEIALTVWSSICEHCRRR